MQRTGERLAVASAFIISSGSVASPCRVHRPATPPGSLTAQRFKVPENGTRAVKQQTVDAISRALLVVRSIVLT